MRINSDYPIKNRDINGSCGEAIGKTQKSSERGALLPPNIPDWKPKGISAQQFRDQRWLERERARVAARAAAQLRSKTRKKNVPDI